MQHFPSLCFISSSARQAFATRRLTAVAACLALGLSACGGGGGDSGGAAAPSTTPATTPATTPVTTPATSPATTASVPPATGTPTAQFTASQSGAQAVVDAVNASAPGLLEAGVLNSVSLVPGASSGSGGSSPPTKKSVMLQALSMDPSQARDGDATTPDADGVVQALATTNSTVACAVSGSVQVSLQTASSTTLSTGDTATETLLACSPSANVTLDGTAALTFTRYATAQDFALTLNLTGLTVKTTDTTHGAVTYGPYSLAVDADVSSAGSVTRVTVGDTVISGAATASLSGRAGLIGSGSARRYVGSGYADLRLTNWRFDPVTGQPASGSALVNGANNSQASVTVQSAGYRVVLFIDGASTSWTVPF